MRFVLNEDYDSRKVIEADYFDWRADNRFITFWKDDPRRAIPVFTIKSENAYTIEVEQSQNQG